MWSTTMLVNWVNSPASPHGNGTSVHHPTVMTVMSFIVQLLFKFQPANLTHDSFVALQPFLTISARNLDTRQFRHLTAFFQNFSRQPQHPSPSSPYLFKTSASNLAFRRLTHFFEISAGNLVAGPFRRLTHFFRNFSRQPGRRSLSSPYSNPNKYF